MHGASLCAMGITRKALSTLSLGLIDWRSDKERTAGYTKRSAKEAKKQTKILREQGKRTAQ